MAHSIRAESFSIAPETCPEADRITERMLVSIETEVKRIVEKSMEEHLVLRENLRAALENVIEEKQELQIDNDDLNDTISSLKVTIEEKDQMINHLQFVIEELQESLDEAKAKGEGE